MRGESRPVYEFGPFRLDPLDHLLLRDGIAVPLAPKTFDLLEILVERHGRLVEKDELLRLVWPDTVVEESNLSYNVSVLRKALGDGSEAGRFIETVPKRGYRFVAPVTEQRHDTPSAGRVRKHSRWFWVAAALGVLSIGSLAAWKVVSTQLVDLSLEAVPLTTYAGRELYPSLSPDGNHVAFSWSGASDGDLRIYVQPLGGSVPKPITSGPGDDFSPAWSPGGESIAFLRLLPGKATAGIYLIPAGGGVARQVAPLDYIRPALLEFSHGVELAWHPGGKWLVVTERLAPEASPGLCLVSAVTGEKRMLIPPVGTPGADLAPAFRPDGKYLAFARVYYFGASDLYGVRISDDVAQQGPLERLTSQPAHRTVSPVWTPYGRDILFLAGPFTGDLYLWRLQPENPGAARRIAALGTGASFLSIPQRSGAKVRLAYAREIRDSNIWRLRVAQSSDHRPTVITSPALLINSTREDGNAQFSPDGRRIAFMSSRSGALEIWVSRSDSSNPQQVTWFDGVQVGAPQWAPDSERIAVHARHQGRSELFVVKASGGGLPRPLSREPILGSVPSWSRDGRWIYFSSNKFDLCKIPAEGGPIVQLTVHGGSFGLESFDRKWVYYSKLTESAYSLWKVTPDGAGESQVLESLAFTRSFTVTEDGIYFIPRPAAPNRAPMRFLDFATGNVSDVVPLKTFSYGITVSPLSPGQPRTILYDQVDQSGSDLMLVGNLVAGR